jgi:hypothetical protein
MSTHDIPHSTLAGRTWNPPQASAAPRGRRTHKESWVRGLYILLFMLVYSAVQTVVTAVVVLQFAWSLIDGKPNARLTALGRSIGDYAREIIAYVTYASNDKPFPVGPWPAAQ